MANDFLRVRKGITLTPRSADPSNPIEGDLQSSDGTARQQGIWQYRSSQWCKLGTELKVAYIKDVKTASTNGGTFTSGAWQKRDLNTTSGDTGIVSISSSQFTLQIGVYTIKATAPAFDVSRHMIRLYDTTSSTEYLGTNEYAVSSTLNRSSVDVKITVTEASVFEIQHRCQVTVSSNGLGVNNNFASNSIYTQVEITKH